MARKFNLASVNVLIAHGSQTVATLHESMLRGFGVRQISIARSPRDLVNYFGVGGFDLALIDNSIGPDIIPAAIRSVRQGKTATDPEIAILLSYCHSSMQNVVAYRDCGANMIMSLPFTIGGVFDRLCWIATKPRPFIVSQSYVGPCRRVRRAAPHENKGRRHDDDKRDAFVVEDSNSLVDAS